MKDIFWFGGFKIQDHRSTHAKRHITGVAQAVGEKETGGGEDNVILGEIEDSSAKARTIVSVMPQNVSSAVLESVHK
ncbi:conserved hypothetical protein [delta proteobacterium NaphS2]|nr:conserved hypothetical protein [delta proteobacterium NaphS2]